MVRADWVDLEAAAELAVKRAELAVVRIESDANRIRFELSTATDEPGEMIASRVGATDNPGGENIEITLTARIGRFGDNKREAKLLKSMRQRLEQLRGVETAPYR